MEPPETVSSSDLPMVVSSSATNNNNVNVILSTNNNSSNSDGSYSSFSNNITTISSNTTTISSSNDRVCENSSSNHHGMVSSPNENVGTNHQTLIRNHWNIARENVSLKQRVQQLETENMKYQQQLLDREDELSDLKIDVEAQKKKADIMKLELNEKRANNIRLQSEIQINKIDVNNIIANQYECEELRSTYNSLVQERDGLIFQNSGLQMEMKRLREELETAKARLVIAESSKATKTRTSEPSSTDKLNILSWNNTETAITAICDKQDNGKNNSNEGHTSFINQPSTLGRFNDILVTPIHEGHTPNIPSKNSQVNSLSELLALPTDVEHIPAKDFPLEPIRLFDVEKGPTEDEKSNIDSMMIKTEDRVFGNERETLLSMISHVDDDKESRGEMKVLLRELENQLDSSISIGSSERHCLSEGGDDKSNVKAEAKIDVTVQENMQEYSTIYSVESNTPKRKQKKASAIQNSFESNTPKRKQKKTSAIQNSVESNTPKRKPKKTSAIQTFKCPNIDIKPESVTDPCKIHLLELCEKFSVPIMRMEKNDAQQSATLFGFIYFPKSENNIDIVSTLSAMKDFLLTQLKNALKYPSNILRLAVSMDGLEVAADHETGDIQLFTSICVFFCGLVSELYELRHGRKDVLESLIKRRLEVFENESHTRAMREPFGLYSCVLPLQIVNAEIVRRFLLGVSNSTIKAVQKTVKDRGVAVDVYNQYVIITHKSDPGCIGAVASIFTPLMRAIAFNSSFFLEAGHSVEQSFKNRYVKLLSENKDLFNQGDKDEEDTNSSDSEVPYEDIADKLIIHRVFGDELIFTTIWVNKEKKRGCIIWPANYKKISKRRRELALEVISNMNFNAKYDERGSGIIDIWPIDENFSNHAGVIGDAINYLAWASKDITMKQLKEKLKSRIDINNTHSDTFQPYCLYSIVSFLSRKKTIDQIKGALIGSNCQTVKVIRESIGECFFSIRKTFTIISCENLFQQTFAAIALVSITKMVSKKIPFNLDKLRAIATSCIARADLFKSENECWVKNKLQVVKSGYLPPSKKRKIKSPVRSKRARYKI